MCGATSSRSFFTEALPGRAPWPMQPPQARVGLHLPFAMRFRFLAAANLATVLAFSIAQQRQALMALERRLGCPQRRSWALQHRNILTRVTYGHPLQCRLAAAPWLNRRLPSAGPKSDGLFCKLSLLFACLCGSDASRAASSCVCAAQPHTHQRILLQPRIRHCVCSL
jgi:hypothetical protein